MTTMDHEAVYDAFAPLVTTFASTNSVPVAYPGLHFDPPSEGPWLELSADANDNGEDYGIGDGGPANVLGFFRVRVCNRPGNGINAAAALAESLIADIPKGTEIGPARIYQVPRLTGPVTDDTKLMHTVTWRYRGTRYA